MANRLTIDANLVGYWGFDEASETDVAVDASGSSANLTVSGAPGVETGRVANARQFNGSSTFASVSNALLGVSGDLTIIVWARLSTFNSSGSTLRTLLCCGPSPSGNTLYSLFVDQNGRVVYKHDSPSGEVVARTDANVIKVGRYFNVVLRRTTSGSVQTLELYLDHVEIPFTTITVAGSPSSFPIPQPAANASPEFNVGRGRKESDQAYWDGAIDELSVHNIARSVQPYLNAVYFQTVLANTTSKLSVRGTAKAIASYEMGRGIRWWCFERDGDLYVTKESPFGRFGPETLLTTVGAVGYSSARKPNLVYDEASDTLYVFFIAGNRIYKLTALSADDPATVNMPFTADTGTIIKSLDHTDAARLGEGGGQGKDFNEFDFTYVTRSPIKINFEDSSASLGEGGGENQVTTFGTPNTPQIAFGVKNGVFGIFVGALDSENGGFTLYRINGGVQNQITSPAPVIDAQVGTYFFAITNRTYGAIYVAEALRVDGVESGRRSVAIVDRFSEVHLDATGNLDIGQEGDAWDSGSLGDGGGDKEVVPSDFSYVNRSPLKLSTQDPDVNSVGEGGGMSGSVTQSGTTVML